MSPKPTSASFRVVISSHRRCGRQFSLHTPNLKLVSSSISTHFGGVNMKKQTRTCSLLSALLILLAIPAIGLAQDGGGSASETLTNDRVITMVKAGLSPSIIVNKIHASKSNFNTNTDELIRLQQARVPTEIINAMVEASSHVSAVTSSTGAGDVLKADPNDPASAHEAGIYLYQEKDRQKKMFQLEPAVSKQTKTGGFLASAVTYGIAKIKFKASLLGQNDSFQI